MPAQGDLHRTDTQDRLDRAEAGDELVLAPGTYPRPLRLVGRRGRADAPITLTALPGAVLDAGVEPEAFRVQANRLAQAVWTEGVTVDGRRRWQGYPGLWPWLLKGQLVLERCRHVTLRNPHLRRSWPTLIALDRSQDVRIEGCRLENGTFAIGARGAETRRIAVDRCSWVQDTVPGRLWREIPWRRIHGDPTEGEPVEVQADWRLFDGDFFRGDEIAGDVLVERCAVQAAFNAVHLFNDRGRPELANNVEVRHCTFREIRDNVIEAEIDARNWWFHHNSLWNCHKWFSFEPRTSGFFYVFANQAGHDSVQGPSDDAHRGGGVFKAAKATRPAPGRHHVFHNSFSTRSDYIRKGLFARFEHRNNAVRFARPGDPAFLAPATVFGDLTAPADPPDRRFTTAWAAQGIAMAGDVVGHPAWPDALRAAGYPIGPTQGADPLFRDPFRGDLRLRPDSPCRGTALPLAVALPDGTTWTAPAGADVGAWQGEQLLAGPAYVPLPMAGS